MNNSTPTIPTGTVTFLFTDIQGSTPLWEREPEKMAVALQIHNNALRSAIEANGGVVFKTVGDAFQAAFATAPQALKAAIEGQRVLQSAAWNELGPLAVRMGLHTGEAELDPGGDEYAVSHTKNRIGRIHSVASGGQILLSQETADLVVRTLPEGVSLKDLGEHRLKGMQWTGTPFPGVRAGPAAGIPTSGNNHHPSQQPAVAIDLLHRARERDGVREGFAAQRPPGNADRPGRDGQNPPGARDCRQAAGAVRRWRLAGGAGAAVGSCPGAHPHRPRPGPARAIWPADDYTAAGLPRAQTVAADPG